MLVPGAHEQLEQLADCEVATGRIGKGKFVTDLVAVAPAVAAFDDISGGDEVRDDPERAPLGDFEGRRDLAQAHPGVPSDAEQRPGVVGEEVPVAHTA